MNVQQISHGQASLNPAMMGREAQLIAFKHLCQRPSTSSAMVVSGPAGIGKTTLVKAFEELARQDGWRIVTDTSCLGLSERMRGTYFPALFESFSGAEVSSPEENCSSKNEIFLQQSLSEQLFTLAHLLQSEGAGLLITVDDINRSALQHLGELSSAIFSAQEQGLPVQWVLSGRTAEIRDFLDSEMMAGVELAEHFELSALTRSQTEAVMRQTLESCTDLNAESLSDALIARACLATQGHPHMVYLVAEALRQQVTGDLSEHHLTTGIASAQEQLGSLVLNPLLAKLSAGDRAFLEAMAADDGPSKMSDISARLGRNPQYAGVYRNRLLESQIIRSASYGKVTFVYPHLREYLRACSAQLAEDSFNSF